MKEHARDTVTSNICDGCQEETYKMVMVDEYGDISLECVDCGYEEGYDGEPLSMMIDGVYS